MRPAPDPPLLGLGILVALAGLAGTLAAYTPLTARPLADVTLAALWLLAAAALTRRPPPRPRPALIGVAALIALTLAAVPFADPLSSGLDALRIWAWPLTALLLGALWPWGDAGRDRALYVALAVAGVALAWSALRHLTGSSGLEEEVARAALPGVPDHLSLRFYGSMPTAQQLAVFATAVLPLALAAALPAGGRRRVAFAAVVALAVFVIVATEVRTAAVAAVAATLLTTGLFAFARGPGSGRRRRTAAIAVIAVALAGASSYVAVVANDEERANRYSGILDPASDESIDARLERWGDALPEVFERPLGHGLATSGLLAAEQSERAVVEPNLDNDLLAIGIAQGPAVMLLMIVVIGGIGFVLVRRSRIVEHGRPPLAAGAAGALAALCVMAMMSFTFEQLQALPVWLLVGLALGWERPR